MQLTKVSGVLTLYLMSETENKTRHVSCAQVAYRLVEGEMPLTYGIAWHHLFLLH